MKNTSKSPKKSNIKEITENEQARLKNLLARLPKPINCIRKEGNKILKKLLDDCFGSIDDTLFELAKKTVSQEDQDNYFFAMREVRKQNKSISDDFIQSINSAYSQLAIPNSSRESLTAFSKIKTSELSIVDNDDLDKIVAKEALASRVSSEFEHPLQLLANRINSIVQAEVGHKEIPVSPDSLCDNFSLAIKGAPIDSKSTIIIYKVFEKTILSNLGQFYALMNTLLHDRGILPHEPHKVDTNTDTNSLHNGSGGLHMPIVSCEGIPNCPPSTTKGKIEGNTQQVRSLYDLLQQYTASPSTLSNNYLSNIINTAHKNNALTTESSIKPEDLHSIEILDEMFHNINQTEMAGPLKALFQNLQIPLAKLALTDKSFFNDPRHSARQLLNKLSSAAIKFDNSNPKSLNTDPLYQQIEKSIHSLLYNPAPESKDFSEQITHLHNFSEKETRKEQLFEKHLINAEQGRLKSLQVETDTLEAIREVCQGMYIAESVYEIIHSAWKKVMVFQGLKFGTDSQQWDESIQTLIELVTSTQEYANASDLQQATASIQSLKEAIANGLQDISYDAFRTEELVTKLEHTFKQLITPQPDTSKSKGVEEPQVRKVSKDLSTVETKTERISIADAFYNQAKNLSRGSWFDFHQNGNIVRCRLAAILSPYNQYIFVSRSGIKVTDMNLDDVAFKIQNQELNQLDSNHIFDSALEKVITGNKKGTLKKA